MHELEAIVLANEKSIQRGDVTFLATIVSTLGSTYRQKGAKMLITETGEMVGTLSGGCIESDIFHHTKRIISEPLLIDYDATKVEEDLIWGFGLGCDGAVKILLEKLNPSNSLSPLNLISQCLRSKKNGAIATIFSLAGAIEPKIGSRLVIYPDNTTYTDIHDHDLIKAIAQDTVTAKKEQKSTINIYQLGSSTVEVFIEGIKPPCSLIVFGAGRDVLPVVKLAKAIGWHVTVVDCRALQKTYQRFAIADEIILTRREAISQHVSVDRNNVAVVMTHHYFDDLDIIELLLPTDIPYLGVMGSKKRITNIIKQLNPTQIQLDKLYSPIGLDIGADTPEEIASAIVAEIQAVLANRNAGFNKHRYQPLHCRDDSNHKQVNLLETVNMIYHK